MPERGFVFIVDDDAANASMLQKLLVAEGYAVKHDTGDTAEIGTITESAPNIVLLGAYLSDHNPFELLSELRSSRQTWDIPVFFMTIADDAETRVKGLESGDDLILMPIDEHEVLALSAMESDAMADSPQ